MDPGYPWWVLAGGGHPCSRAANLYTLSGPVGGPRYPSTPTCSQPAGELHLDLGGPTVYTWAFSDTAPGPLIRATAGYMPRILDNQIPTDTTVRWHRIALRNHADGVPGPATPCSEVPPIPPSAPYATSPGDDDGDGGGDGGGDHDDQKDAGEVFGPAVRLRPSGPWSQAGRPAKNSCPRRQLRGGLCRSSRRGWSTGTVAGRSSRHRERFARSCPQYCSPRPHPSASLTPAVHPYSGPKR